jgi:hypothetical protein
MAMACGAWLGLAAGMESLSPEVVGEMVSVIREALPKVGLRNCHVKWCQEFC